MMIAVIEVEIPDESLMGRGVEAAPPLAEVAHLQAAEMPTDIKLGQRPGEPFCVGQELAAREQGERRRIGQLAESGQKTGSVGIEA